MYQGRNIDAIIPGWRQNTFKDPLAEGWMLLIIICTY